MRTGHIVVLVLFFSALSGYAHAAKRTVTVCVDERVELFSIIFRLAGNPEYRKGRIAAYARAVDAHFGPHRNHPVVKIAAKLRRTRGVSYDAPMSLVAHVKNAATLEGLVPFDPWPEGLDKRWGKEGLRDFLAAARDFHRVSKFETFVRKNRRLYVETKKRFRRVLAREKVVSWFESFFGVSAGARFHIALGLLNGPCCFGASLRRGKREDLYCVLGTWTADAEGVPTFDASYLPTVVHEFCHSFANPIADRHGPALEAAASRIFRKVEKEMRKQAYGSWQTMMRESLVRASVVRWVLTHKGMKAAREEVRRNHERGFIWMGKLATLLSKYERQRDRYPTMDSFMPVVIVFFSKTASWVEKVVKERRAAAPRVLTLSPRNGARNVDPATSTIVVTFDRPMRDRCWSVCGGGPTLPKIAGKLSYDAACKVLTVPVRLVPNRRYRFWLNVDKFRSFKSREGVPLEPTQVTFETGARR